MISPMTYRRHLLVVAAGVLALAACGGGDDDDSAATTPPTHGGERGQRYTRDHRLADHHGARHHECPPHHGGRHQRLRRRPAGGHPDRRQRHVPRSRGRLHRRLGPRQRLHHQPRRPRRHQQPRRHRRGDARGVRRRRHSTRATTPRSSACPSATTSRSSTSTAPTTCRTSQWHDDAIEAGLDVYAAGYPLGDPEFTLTRGIVAKAEAGGDLTGTSSIDHTIEHDANIQPGNSGGPLVDAEGKVVAVNYAGGASATTTAQFYAHRLGPGPAGRREAAGR